MNKGASFGPGCEASPSAACGVFAESHPSRGDPTALSYWFPKVRDAGLPVPKTRSLTMPEPVQKVIFACLWGDDVDTGLVEPFIAELRAAASDLGSPFFLRTDYTSGKHQWRSACFVEDPEQLGRHVFAIAEFSECADFLGLPWETWVAREMLPTMPVGVCPGFEDMPVCKEFRFFVNGSTIECFHPYWPREALEQGGCHLSDAEYAALCSPGADEAELWAIAAAAGVAVGGRWSVDLLATERGWFLTDMAEADKSYHWPDCARDRDAAPRGREAAEAEGQQPGPPEEAASPNLTLSTHSSDT